MNLDGLYRQGYERAWTEDAEVQEKFCSIVAEARRMSLSTLRRANPLFVPNDTYLEYVCGSEIKSSEFGIYREDVCYWNNNLVIPITDLRGEIQGFAGFNPFIYAGVKEGSSTENYYKYTPKEYFAKGRFLYGVEGTYRKAMSDGYLVLVDGMFDAISLSAAGFHAMALMSSTLTQEILMQLRFIRKVILISDNDEAGRKVYYGLTKCLRNVYLLKQGYTNDVDELLKTNHRDSFTRELRSMVEGYSERVCVFK